MADETNNSLFSQDVLDSMEAPHLFNQKHEGPVTVLGKTFDSDEERRAYFREELRKKLPELKKIEGFPIGEDDDIIALSDPPYYTACPNPWLNDFVAEWEEEKKKLVAEGKRAEEKVVTEPYASDVSEGKGNPVYMAHTYHTKVPHPAIMRYILHYTEPGDIILDGFAGTGMTAVAAAACAKPLPEDKVNIENDWKAFFNSKPKWGYRHAICNDLSPYASLISYNYTTPINKVAVKKEITRIYNELFKEYGWMYQTKVNGKDATINYVVWSNLYICKSCGREINYWEAALDRKGAKILDEFECPHCKVKNSKDSKLSLETQFDTNLGESVSIPKCVPVLIVCTTKDNKRHEIAPSDFDFEVVKKIEELRFDLFYPTDRMPEGGESRRNDRYNITHVHQFFTRRNLLLLSAFYNKIQQSPLSSKLMFFFTSMISRSTKMNRFSTRNYFHGGGGWCLTGLSGTLYMPALPMEVSVLEQIEGKLNLFDKVSPALPDFYSNASMIGSATKLPVESDSIDYIFVDPPFGANLMYSELNFIPESWVRLKTDSKKEAIVNEAVNKSLFDYQTLMNESLAEFYRILKPGKWITMEFSNTSAAVWNSIQNALQGVGFVVANVAALDKKQGSFKAVTTTTAVKQDLVITCFKPTAEFVRKFDSSFNNEDTIWDFIVEYLHHLPVHIEKGNATTTVVERSPKILFDRLISYYVQRGLQLPLDAADFQSGLRQRFEEYDGMFFLPSQLNEYLEKKKQAPEFIPMGLIVSNEADGIEWLRNRLRDNPQTYQDIQPDWLQAINAVRKYDILPGLDVLLDENFIQEADGRWRLPNIQDDVDKDKLREKALLKEFKIYVEAASKPRARIKEVRVEAIRCGFKKCYMDKDFATIVLVGDKISQNLLTEDEILLQFYDIARTRV